MKSALMLSCYYIFFWRVWISFFIAVSKVDAEVRGSCSCFCTLIKKSYIQLLSVDKELNIVTEPRNLFRVRS